MSEERGNKEDLTGLLDSFETEDVLYQKMDSFAKSKEEQKKIARLKRRRIPENEYTINQEFIVPKDNDYTIDELPTFHTIQPDSKTIERLDVTRVFNQQTQVNTVPQPAETVRFDDKKIQEMIEKEKGPVLTRKKASRSSEKKSATRILIIILSALIGILTAAIIILGFYKYVLPAFTGANQPSYQYEELKKFADDYDSLSAKGKEGIVALEKVYNQLSDEQKAKINAYFKETAGKTFDELLAEAKSKDKENAANNNTQIAEAKAKIKNEIASLQEQVDKKQASLDKITQEINTAYEAYSAATTAYQKTQADLTTAQNNYYAASQSYNAAVARQQELQGKVASQTITPEEQIELDSLAASVQTYLAAVTETQTIFNNATAANNQAYADLTNAQSEYESIQYNDSGLASEITALKKQIAAKQEELNSLK